MSQRARSGLLMFVLLFAVKILYCAFEKEIEVIVFLHWSFPLQLVLR